MIIFFAWVAKLFRYYRHNRNSRSLKVVLIKGNCRKSARLRWKSFIICWSFLFLMVIYTWSGNRINSPLTHRGPETFNPAAATETYFRRETQPTKWRQSRSTTHTTQKLHQFLDFWNFLNLEKNNISAWKVTRIKNNECSNFRYYWS